MNCPKSALSQFIRALVSLQDEFKNSRKSRSRRGNEAEVSFAPKSASYSENEIRGNARPHPDPLPQERGMHAACPGIFMLSGVASPHGDLSRRLPFLNTRWVSLDFVVFLGDTDGAFS